MSKWVTFSRDYDHAPKAKPLSTVAYRKGRSYNVPDEHAAAAIEAGAAEEIAAPATREEAAQVKAEGRADGGGRAK